MEQNTEGMNLSADKQTSTTTPHSSKFDQYGLWKAGSDTNHTVNMSYHFIVSQIFKRIKLVVFI